MLHIHSQTGACNVGDVAENGGAHEARVLRQWPSVPTVMIFVASRLFVSSCWVHPWGGIGLIKYPAPVRRVEINVVEHFLVVFLI